MTPLQRRLADRLRGIAAARGWSQGQLADFCGLGRAQMTRLLTGRHSPRLDTLERIADALGVRVVDLLGD